MVHPRRFDELLGSLGSPRTSSASRLPPRERDKLPAIPDHELIHCIGQGAYGEVWLARSVLGTCRAVKIVFRDSFSSDQPYEREFRGIQHFEPVSRTDDGLMDILQVGRNDAQGCFYYVMELADRQPANQSLFSAGSATRYVPRTLHSDLKEHRRLPGAECVQLGLALSSALGHLHRHGLIHRDIKPSNIIFVQGVAKLADIGLVVEVEEARSFVGTEGYIPPEGPTSARADLYSLGKVLYEASNGKDRKDFPEPMAGLRELPDRAEQELLLELNAVILKACVENAGERYQTAEELHADLALIRSGKSVRRRRRLETRVVVLTRVAVAAGIVAAVGFGGYTFQKRQTATAQRFSEENRQLAGAEARQRQRAESALLNVQLQRVQELLGQQKRAQALTQLAFLLRRNGTNRFIAEQTLATLSSHNFALPLARLSRRQEVQSARFVSDGSRVVTASTNGIFHVRDARTGASISKIPIYEAGAHHVQISPDGEWVAMAGEGEVRIASTRTGKVRKVLSDGGDIQKGAFNGDASQLLIVNGAEISVWEVRTGKMLLGPLKHKDRVDSASFGGSGDFILSSSREDFTARLWETGTGRPVRSFEHRPPRYSWTSPVLSPDGKRLITLATTDQIEGNAARIWNPRTGEALSAVIDCKYPINVLTFSPDGSKVAIAGNNRLVQIYDGQTGERVAGPFKCEEAIRGAAFSADGRKLAALCGTRIVRIWDINSGQMLVSCDSRSGRNDFLEFSPKGDLLLLSGDGAGWIWEVQEGAAKSLVLRHDEAVTFAQFSPDGQRAVTTMDERVSITHVSRPLQGRAALLWDAHTGRQTAPPLLHKRGVTSAGFSPDGKRVVTTSWDRTARLWNAETGEALRDPLVHPRAVRSAAFSGDGKQLWTGSWRHSAWLWQVESGGLVRDLLKNEGELSDVEIWPIRTDDLSADGKWLLTSGAPGQVSNTVAGVQVWNAHTGKPRYVPSKASPTIRSAQFSPDGERFVTTSNWSQGVGIWSSRTGELLVPLLAHQAQAPVNYAEFSSDGRKVVTAGNDGTACIWNSETGRLIAQPIKHKGEVVHAAFSPDSKRIVTASWWDYAAFIWDAESGFQIGEALRHDDWVTFATFSPDGKSVITTSTDKTAKIWEVPVATLPIPEWLADLAEAVAGQLVDSAGTTTPVPLERLHELRLRLTASTATDVYTRFGKWFFADRSTRRQSASFLVP